MPEPTTGRAVGLNISLPLEMATLVRGAVESGLYSSASEVVREAVRTWAAGRGLTPGSTEASLAGAQRTRLIDLFAELDALTPATPPADARQGSTDHDAILYGDPNQ